MCVCIPILVTTFPKWLSGTEPLPHTPGAVHPRCVCSVLHACVQFCRFDKADATTNVTFSDTAITDRHSDITIFQLRAHWVRISWFIGSEKSFGHVPPVGVEPRLPAWKASTLSTRPARLSTTEIRYLILPYIVHLGL